MLKLIKMVAALMLVLLLASAASIAVARSLYLPRTTCSVTPEAVEALDMKLTYAEASRRLGCEGVLTKREVWSPELRQEIYQWRGAVWPFGRFEGVFYNDSLEAKEARWIVLNLSAARTPDRAAN